MKIVLLLAVVGLTVGKPSPQGAVGGAPKRKLWLKLDDDSLEVYGSPRHTFKTNKVYSKVGGKAVPSYYYGSSEEMYYGSPSVAYAKSQYKSVPSNVQGNPNFYYDNSGELKIIPDPALMSQVYSQLYSNLPAQGPNGARYYIDSSGEVGLATDRFMTRLFRSNQNSNLYRDTSGELLYVYPQGSRPGSYPSGTSAVYPSGTSAVATA